MIICALFSMSLFSAPLLQLGANASYNAPIADDAFSDGLKEIENYTFGVEARVNLFDWVSFAVPATFGGFGGDGILITTMPSLNLNIPAADFLDIALGLGMRMDFLHSGDSWYINGTSVDEAGNTDYSGQEAILQKLEMVTDYLADSWGLDIQALHEEVQERQTHIDELDLVTLD